MHGFVDYRFYVFLLTGIGGQHIFIDQNGDAEVDLTLLDMRWPYTSKLHLLLTKLI